MSRAKLNIALVGLGFGKEFIPIYQNHPNTNMYAICQRSTDKLSEVGERYAATCRRLLTDLDAADILAASEKSAPGGTLAITAPVLSGEEVLRPILFFVAQVLAAKVRIKMRRKVLMRYFLTTDDTDFHG